MQCELSCVLVSTQGSGQCLLEASILLEAIWYGWCAANSARVGELEVIGG